MNLAEAANLILTLSLKDQVSSGLRGLNGQLDRTNQKAASVRGGLSKIGQGIGVGIRNTGLLLGAGFAAIWKNVDAGIGSLVELQQVTLQTEAVIKSTGGAAGLTAQQIRDMSQALEDQTTIDDKTVQSAANVLLTFTSVKKDAFEPALQAALDLSVAMGQDLNSSVVQVGKALNDPVRGMTALRRVGVSFSSDQEKVIKKMVETGDTAGAQKLILDELTKEFGGSATKAAEGYQGTQARLKDTIEDLRMALAEALLPALENVSRKLRAWLQDPQVKDGIKKLGEGIAGIFSGENIDRGIGIAKDFFGFLRDLPWANIKEGLGFAADNAKKVVDVFKSLPPGVQAGLLTFLAANKLTGGLVSKGIGELLSVGLSSLKTITAGSVTVIGPVTGGPGGGVPGVPVAGAGAAAAGLGIGTIAAGVGAGAVGATMIVAAVAAGSDAIQRAQGKTDEQIRIEGEIATAQQALSHATTRESAAQIQAHIDSLRAQEAQIATNTRLDPQQISELVANRRAIEAGLTPTVRGVDDRLGIANLRAQGIVANTATTAQRVLGILDDTQNLTSIDKNMDYLRKKPWAVNVSVRTNFSVSAREVARAVDHYRAVSNTGGVDVS